MIGTLPRSKLAPLDYRYALDAALAIMGANEPLVVCGASELRAELEQRLPTSTAPACGGLWVEPDARTWHVELGMFARALAPDAPLVIIASQPLARLLPERRGWRGAALGLRARGIGRLCAALAPAGFAPPTRHGIHTAAAIGLNALGAQIARRGRPDLADRLRFAARLRYRAEGWQAGLATVALLVTSKTVGKFER